jgi:hypothetical protein
MRNFRIEVAVTPAPGDQVGAQMAILYLVHGVSIMNVPQSAICKAARPNIGTKILEELALHPGTCSRAQVLDRGCSVEIHPLQKGLEDLWRETAFKVVLRCVLS